MTPSNTNTVDRICELLSSRSSRSEPILQISNLAQPWVQELGRVAVLVRVAETLRASNVYSMLQGGKLSAHARHVAALWARTAEDAWRVGSHFSRWCVTGRRAAGAGPARRVDRVLSHPMIVRAWGKTYVRLLVLSLLILTSRLCSRKPCKMHHWHYATACYRRPGGVLVFFYFLYDYRDEC